MKAHLTHQACSYTTQKTLVFSYYLCNFTCPLKETLPPSGIIGGMTSIITSTVEGMKTEGGVSGFFSGLGKGLVGTVTKPVAGALDFASETAQTVRDMASLSNHR